MLDSVYSALRPILLRMDAERAHTAAIRALELAPLRAPIPGDSRLAVHTLGLDFPNPLGLAAGFDKDARVPGQLLALGLGHVEIGSVTPRPQPGNPQPRLFRLPKDRAVVNRMGFNSEGHEAVARRLQARRPAGILGVNLGANKDSPDRSEDYAAGIRRLGPLASFLTINVSSPNTPGLRNLQAPAELARLLDRLASERTLLETATGRRPPMLVKLSPDIAEDELPDTVGAIMAGGADGIAISNTTLARDGLKEAGLAAEAGGLSGRPLMRRSTRMLAKVHLLTRGRLPLVGIGGVDSGEAALAKILAGASLVQLYTGLVYEGPCLLQRIKRHLAGELQRRGARSLADLRGLEAERWASVRG